MPAVTHNIPITTGQAHHMTLRLVQSYGAPVPAGEYAMEGTVLQDGISVPIAATQAAPTGILLTIPPLAPGNHPFTLTVKNKTSNVQFPILQGNCLVSELIDIDPLDNAAIEQITATLKEDLSDVTVTVQIAPDITASALNAVASASGIIADIRKTAELETAKAVASIDRSATEATTHIQAAGTQAITNIDQVEKRACSAVQATATAGQTSIQTAQATATTAIETAKTSATMAIDTSKNQALSTIAGTVDTGINTIQTAQAAATAAIAAAQNDALAAIAEAVEAGEAQFAASIDAILSSETLIARLKTACGIPALETAIEAKADTSALSAYIPYAKIGRALTKASDGTIDVDLSNYSGTTVKIFGTTSACIGRSTSECMEVTNQIAQMRHTIKTEMLRGTSYIHVMAGRFVLDSDSNSITHAYMVGSSDAIKNTGTLDIQAYQEIAMRSNKGNYPGLCVNGDLSTVIIRKNTTTTYNELARFNDTSTTMVNYTYFPNGHN